MIDQRERCERIAPSDANEPIEQSEPAEPIEPIDRTDPTEPIERTEPFDAIESSDPSDQSDHLDTVCGGSVGCFASASRVMAVKVRTFFGPG